MPRTKRKKLNIALTDPISEFNEHLLIVNGTVLKESSAYESPRGHLHGFIYSVIEGDALLREKLSDLKHFFSSLYVAKIHPWNPLLKGVEFYFEEFGPGQSQTMRFKFEADGEEWRNMYSMSEYARSLAAAAISHNDEISYYQQDQEYLGGGFGLECDIRSMEASVKAEIEYWSDKVRHISETAMELVLKNVRQDSVITFFKFPAPVKAACEQYLIYFAQFLNDLGIKAESEIKEEAGRVLFSVTPQDGPAALEKIKEALEAYLDLPQNPEFSTAAGDFPDAAVAQLKANVFFLQSQLALGQAMLQTKDATIEALSLTVFQQRQLLGGRIPTDEPPECNNAAASEPILGDTVHLTKYEGKLLKVDLPTILRRLKRSFGIGGK